MSKMIFLSILILISAKNSGSGAGRTRRTAITAAVWMPRCAGAGGRHFLWKRHFFRSDPKKRGTPLAFSRVAGGKPSENARKINIRPQANDSWDTPEKQTAGKCSVFPVAYKVFLICFFAFSRSVSCAPLYCSSLLPPCSRWMPLSTYSGCRRRLIWRSKTKEA